MNKYYGARYIDEILNKLNKSHISKNSKINSNDVVDIILPVYNGHEYLAPLFDSILRNTTIPYRIIAVNDCSPDLKVKEYLRGISANNKDILLIDNEVNLGFIGSVNKAVSFCKNDFVILNTDTEVPPGWLERLVGPLKRDRRIASVTPFSNAATICSFPEIAKDNAIYESMSVDQLDSFFRMVDPSLVVDVPTGVGFCMAVNYDVVKKNGMFDPVFGKGYGEENDWCLRAKSKGYRNVILPGLFVYHKHGGSFNSAEKQKLVENNLKIIAKRYPHYLPSVSDFIRTDPLLEIRTLLEYSVLSHKRDCVMIFDHNIGGGAALYREQNVRTLLSEGGIVLLVKYIREMKIYLLSFMSGNKPPVILYFRNLSALDKIAGIIKLKRMIINNLVTYPDIISMLKKIAELKKEHGFDITMLIHDYYCVCADYNLIGVKEKYCGMPDVSECGFCYKDNDRISQMYRTAGIVNWRRAWFEVLSVSDNIICFSNSSVSIIQKAFPGITLKSIKVIPHKVDDIRQIVKRQRADSKINIGVIGAISEHKGLNILEEMASIRKQNQNINIIIIGSSSRRVKGIRKTGKFSRDELADHIENNDIDIIFIPSVWPETFSYTTEEAIKTGLPVAVFDIGAPAERVRNYNKGLIISKIDASTALAEIITFLTKE